MSSDGTPSATEAVRALFVAHAVDVHGYVSRRVGRELADDVVAETFRRAIESWDSFEPERDAARGWLFGIATNLLRRRRTQWQRARAPLMPGL